MKRATVLLADDHAIVLEGLRRILEPDFDVIGVVGDGLSLVDKAKLLRPDLIIVDVSMPLLNGIEAARQVRMSGLSAKFIFLSMHPDVIYVCEAFRAGGSAYVLKSSAGAEILTAIREVLEGRTYVTPSIDRANLEAQLRRDKDANNTVDGLSPRRREVLQMTAEGRSTKEIAEILQISPRTVEFHRYRAMAALGLHSVAELVQYAVKHRMITP